MNSLLHRKLLGVLGRSALARIAFLLMRPGRTRPRTHLDGAEHSSSQARSTIVHAGAGEDPLLPEVRQWVDRLRARGTTVVVHPVSRMQCEFGLGYARACALAGELEQHGEWTVTYDGGGTRHARIHRMA